MTIASRLKLNIGLSTAVVFMMMMAFGTAIIIENDLREQSLFADQLMRGVFELSLISDYYIRHPEERPKAQWQRKHAALLEILKKRRYKQGEKVRLEPINQSLSDLEAIFNELTGTYASGRGDEPIARQKREQLADLIITRSRAIAETTARMAADSRTAMAAVTRQIAVTFPVLSLLVLSLTVWSATSIRKSIAGPIEQLRQGAARIGSGQLDYRIGLASADELGQLAGEFDRMAQRLKRITASRDELSQEIAERQRAEAALEKAAEQQRLAMEAAELGAWDYRFDTGEVIWDVRCRTQWGIPRGDQIDYAAAIGGIHPEDRVATDEAVKQALAGVKRGAYHREFRVVWPDGSVHWVASYGRVYFMGEGEQRRPVRFIGVNRDITPEKRAAEMIWESQRQNEFLARILERASQPFAVGYPDGRLGLTNRAFEQLTGYSGDELRAINWVETLTPPQWRALEQQKLEELRRSGQPVRYEKEYLRKDGTRLPIELLVHLVTAADGSPEYYYSFLTDITERKRAEEATRRFNAELEARVRERTAQLAAVNKELETFAYAVSHDLKAPLRGIVGYSRLLLEDYADKLDKEGRTFLNNIRQGTLQMSTLIDDLLAYSRMERQVLRSTRVDLPALVRALVAECSEEIRSHGVELRMNLPPLTALADPAGLAVVLRNLLDNALKFTRDATPPVIEIGGRQEDNTVVLWVRDNGIGFDMKFHDRIFEIFQRLQRAEDYPGTGIGLAMVRKAMQRMGGRVWVQSEPGGGATFYLELAL